MSEYGTAEHFAKLKPLYVCETCLATSNEKEPSYQWIRLEGKKETITICEKCFTDFKIWKRLK